MEDDEPGHGHLLGSPLRGDSLAAATNVTDDEPDVTGKIALAHLNEFPDYYTRLRRMEEEAKREHAGR